MPRRRPNDRTTPRRSTRRAPDGLTTAFLLPDLHPWLKEYFADRNLVPVEDEVWQALPEWGPVPEWSPDALVGIPASSLFEKRRALEAIPVPTTAVASTPMVLSVPTTAEGIAAPTILSASIEVVTPALPPQPPLPAIVSPPQEVAIFQTGEARRSTAPVPFVIPVHAAAPPPSRHFLRIARPHVARLSSNAPDLLASFLRQGLEPLRNPGGLLRVSEPAPMVRIPSPWSELLIVNIIGGSLGVLWRDVFWPLLTLLGITNHESRITGLIRVVTAQCSEVWARIRRPHLKRLWKLPTRERRSTAVPRRAFDGLPLGVGSWQLARPAFAFGLALTIILLPLKLFDLHAQFPAVRGRVLSATAEAMGTFRAGGTAIARSSFNEAIADFDRARTALERIPSAAGTLSRVGITVGRHLPGLRSTLGVAEEGRRAGVALAEASASATRGLAAMEGIDLTDPNAAALLDAATAAFTTARRRAEDARSRIEVAAPTLLNTIDRAIGELRRAEQLLPILRALGGIDRPRRLLLVFQNPAELRPTGGFMGSVALVDVARGRVTALELPPGGTYDLSGITRLRVIPPEPLRLVSSTWQFHDANWFPDFPTSARKLRWFYEASGGPSVDAVVAVNAPVLEDILSLTGPITAGGQTFSATAVRTILTDTIESAAARASGRPKTIVAELAPAVFRRLLAITEGGTSTQRIELLDRLIRALEERDVLLAFTDDAAQRHAVEARWAGEIRATDRDALLVVHTNIGGGKSDGVIRDDIQHTATILEDGSLVDTVRVTRTHEGSPAPPTAAPSEYLAGLANVDYLRIYVPRGAELMSAEGFEPPPPEAFEAIPTDAIPDRLLLATELEEAIDHERGVRITEEFGRTVFGGWLQTPPGATRSVRLVYRLPWRYEQTTRGAIGRTVSAGPQPYAFNIQKQPGTRATIHHTIELAPNWRASWTSKNIAPRGAQAWTLEDLLTSDRATGMLIAPK